MKRSVHLGPLLNVLIMAGAMVFASPSNAATVSEGSSVQMVAADFAQNADRADKMEVLKAPEVIDPESDDTEDLAVEVQFHEEDVQDIRAPEVHDPEIEVNTPDIEINTPEIQMPEILDVPSTPEVPDTPDS